MATNVPAPEFTATGFVAPTEADLLSGTFADLQAAFGGGLNPSLSTPQGQIATSMAAMLGAVSDLFLFYTNQVDPSFATGRMQDAIGRIYYLTRLPALSTTVACVCLGAAGTVLPAGSLAQSVDGTIYASVSDATIGAGGTVTMQFAAIITGPLPCPANTVTIIYRSVPGWDAISNPDAGIMGRDVETRAAFEQRRAASVAGNATGILPAIRAAVLAVPGVLDAYVTENATGSTAVIRGVSILAHSLYVAVVGGSNTDVARAIWSKKNPGCGYVGATSVVVQDTGSGYAPPYPSYTVKFQRAAGVPIYVAVEVTDGSDVPSDALEQIRTAIGNAFAGTTDGIGPRIGGTVYASRFYGAVAQLGAWARLVLITVGKTASPVDNDVPLDIDEYPTLDPAHVTLVLS